MIRSAAIFFHSLSNISFSPDSPEAARTAVPVDVYKRQQLEGTIPATLREQAEQPDAGVDASAVCLEDLGDFDDLENAKEKQAEALERVLLSQ